LSDVPRETRFKPGIDGADDTLLVNVLSDDSSRSDASRRHTVLLEAYGYRWYRVGGLDYLLRRSDV
jgi:maltose alpha-D-glucosyltransferase/alpha-amylase